MGHRLLPVSFQEMDIQTWARELPAGKNQVRALPDSPHVLTHYREAYLMKQAHHIEANKPWLQTEREDMRCTTTTVGVPQD